MLMSIDVRTAAADRSSASASATASSSSRASSATGVGRDGCKSEATANAVVTTTVNGETKTVRREDAERGDGCSAHAKARAAIEGSKTEDSTAQ